MYLSLSLSLSIYTYVHVYTCIYIYIYKRCRLSLFAGLLRLGLRAAIIAALCTVGMNILSFNKKNT